jgi:CRP-like cAMP-binding protein
MSHLEDALTRKLRAFGPLGNDELSMLEELQKFRAQIAAGKEVVYEGQQHHAAYILREGWACSYKRLRDGGRQIIDIQIPGDFLGLRSLLLRTSDHSFVTLTDVEVCKINTEGMLDMFRASPRLAVALLWAASRDEAMVVEHLVGIGRRDAFERTAHFLLELGARLKLVGYGTGDSYDCPISQSVLADTLGMTAIHLNRVLRQLREAKVVNFRDGKVVFPDIARAAEITGFDLAYLDHGPVTHEPA